MDSVVYIKIHEGWQLKAKLSLGRDQIVTKYQNAKKQTNKKPKNPKTQGGKKKKQTPNPKFVVNSIK